MKKLFVFAVLCVSCSAAPVGRSVAVAPSNDDPSCTPAPEKMYGAPRADCKEFLDLGFCCGYGHAITLEGRAISCAYMLCRDACDKEFEASFAVCMPTGESIKDPNDETL